MAARAKDMRPVMDQIGMYMTRSVLKTFQAGGRPKWPASIRAMREGGRTLTLSGRLRSSVSHVADKQYVDIGANTIYAAMQQTGGLIRPKRKKALAVPLTKEARRAQENVDSVRDIPDLFFIPTKGGGDTIGILARKKARDKSIVPWFALKTKVKIPARPYLVFQESDIRYIMRSILDYLVREGM